MGILGTIKKKVNESRETAARERTLNKKVAYNEHKKLVKDRAKAYKSQGLNDDEAEFMADRAIKKEQREKRVAESKKKLKDVTTGFGDGLPDRQPPRKAKSSPRRSTGQMARKTPAEEKPFDPRFIRL